MFVFFRLLDTKSTVLIVVAAVGGVLGGALAPIISIALLDRFDSALPVALYVVAGLLITIVSVWLAPETANVDLHDERADERRIVQDPGRLRPT